MPVTAPARRHSANQQRARRSPRMLVADASGAYRPTPLAALGRSAAACVAVDHWIPVPAGTQVLTMPDCRPIGRRGDQAVALDTGLPVAAALPHGYTRTYLPAYVKAEGAPYLPLFAYTAIAERDGALVVAAERTDGAPEWRPERFGTPDLPVRIAALQRALPANGVVQQLSRCAGEYGCYTAQNTFYERWEAALPTSNACNARCIGCISEQEPDGPPTPQARIQAMARQRDIVELATRHLERVESAMVSYGQGCEGEPLLNWKMLVAATRAIRARTERGWININTNGCNPAAMAALIEAGLDACRISVFSARQETFAAYYRPRNYTFAEVEETLRLASAAGLFTSINLLTFPGVTDREAEADALIALLQRTGTRMVQMRSLTIDPEQLLAALPPADSAPIGVGPFLARLRAEVPGVIIGNSSRLPGQVPDGSRAAPIRA